MFRRDSIAYLGAGFHVLVLVALGVSNGRPDTRGDRNKTRAVAPFASGLSEFF